MILDPIATPDISQSEVYVVDSIIPIENLLGGHPDDIRYFIFGSDSTFESNTNIKLQGSIDFTGTSGDSIMMIYDGSQWLELSRSLNPMDINSSNLGEFILDSSYLSRELRRLQLEINDLQSKIDMSGILEIDSLIHIDPSMNATTINALINSIPKNIHNCTLSIYFEDGEYLLDESIKVNGFSGTGNIILYADNPTISILKNSILNSSTNTTSLIIKNCLLNISISNLGIKFDTNIQNSTTRGIYISDSNYVSLKNNSVIADMSQNYGSDIYFENSKGDILDTYVSYGDIGISADRLSEIGIQNCYSDNASNYGISATKGSVISMWDNQTPNGLIQDAFSDTGGQIKA